MQNVETTFLRKNVAKSVAFLQQKWYNINTVKRDKNYSERTKSMNKINSKTARYNFTAPTSDTQLAEWIEKQHSFSVSIRIVIKDFIARHGMTDASCLALSFDNTDMAHTSAPVFAPVAEPETEPVHVQAVQEPVSEPVAAKPAESVQPAAEVPKKEETTNNTSMASSMLDDLMG